MKIAFTSHQEIDLLTPIRKQAVMAISNLNRRDYCNQLDQAELMEQAGLGRGIALLSSSQDDEARTAGEPEELLVADARGGRTPAQMVEQKLLVLLGRTYHGLGRNTTGRLGNIRRIPGK